MTRPDPTSPEYAARLLDAVEMTAAETSETANAAKKIVALLEHLVGASYYDLPYL